MLLAFILVCNLASSCDFFWKFVASVSNWLSSRSPLLVLLGLRSSSLVKLTEYYLETFWKRILPIWTHIVSLLSITMCSDRQAALYIKMSYQAQTSIKSWPHIVGRDLSLLLGGESHPGFIFLAWVITTQPWWRRRLVSKGGSSKCFTGQCIRFLGCPLKEALFGGIWHLPDSVLPHCMMHFAMSMMLKRKGGKSRHKTTKAGGWPPPLDCTLVLLLRLSPCPLLIEFVLLNLNCCCLTLCCLNCCSCCFPTLSSSTFNSNSAVPIRFWTAYWDRQLHQFKSRPVKASSSSAGSTPASLRWSSPSNALMPPSLSCKYLLYLLLTKNVNIRLLQCLFG